MSGSPKNIQRDGRWVHPKTSEDINFSTQQSIYSATPQANGPTAVHVDYAEVHSNILAAVTCPVSNQVIMGVYMDPPVGDNVPFRVKASIINYASILVGYGPASITGTDDPIDEQYYLPFIYEFDDLIMVPALASGDTNFGKALFIGLCLQPPITITATPQLGQLSVQNLGVKPPTMQNAIS